MIDIDTSEVIKELQCLLNKFPNWNKQEIERVKFLAMILQRDCADVIYDMETTFNDMVDVMTGD